MQVVLIAWLFGAFIEGASGFGPGRHRGTPDGGAGLSGHGGGHDRDDDQEHPGDLRGGGDTDPDRCEGWSGQSGT